MAGCLIVVSSLLVLLPTIFAFPKNDPQGQVDFVPERDSWWEFNNRYTDKPRFFDPIEGCPASSFYLDCNHCWCGKGARVAACTLMGCAPVPQIYNFGENGQGCPAGRQFYHQCNSCHCGSDGKTAACTLKACPEVSQG